MFKNRITFACPELVCYSYSYYIGGIKELFRPGFSKT